MTGLVRRWRDRWHLRGDGECWDQGCATHHPPVSGKPAMSAPYCDWCGRAISQAKFQRSGLRWFAVKGVERGYDPLFCDANPEDGKHEPAGQIVTGGLTPESDSAPAGNSPSAQDGSTT